MAAHFLLTRFNLLRDGDDPAVPHRGIDRTWLEPRIDLFERVCVPSIRAQTEQDFRWLVLVHVDTPADLWKRIDTAIEGQGETVPIGVDGWRDILPIVHQATDELVITSRVDNDDALARGYIENVQEIAPSHVGRYIDHFSGAQIHYATGRSRLQQRLRSPFCSRVERNGDVRTTWEYDHTDRTVPVHTVRTPGPWWLQVVHGSNISTRLRYGRPLNAETVTSTFAIDPSLTSDERLAVDWLRYGKDTAVRAVRRRLRPVRRLVGR